MLLTECHTCLFNILFNRFFLLYVFSKIFCLSRLCMRLSQDSYGYPGEIVLIKGFEFEEATTDEDNNEEEDDYKSKELLKYTIRSMDIISNRSQAQTKNTFL